MKILITGAEYFIITNVRIFP